MRPKRPPLTRVRIKLRLAALLLDGALLAGGARRRGLINLAAAWVAEATHEIRQIPRGASGTARKAPGAVSSGTASRRSARVPQLIEAG